MRILLFVLFTSAFLAVGSIVGQDPARTLSCAGDNPRLALVAIERLVHSLDRIP
jgi:hypothetical protein